MNARQLVPVLAIATALSLVLADTGRAEGAPAFAVHRMTWQATEGSSLPLMDGAPWHVASQRDPGHWLAYCASEHPPALDVAWDWYRSPTDIGVFERMGLDMLAQHLTNEDQLARKRESLTRVVGSREAARRDRFRLEWVERTGGGLAPVTFIHESEDGPDGYVRPGGSERLGPGWYELCFSSPRTAEWTTRKIRTMQHHLRPVLPKWRGKDAILWCKEVLTWLYPYYDERGKGPLMLKGCYCQHCVSEFQRWLAARYGEIEALNADIDGELATFDAIAPPTIGERFEKPGLFWLWMKYRDWAYVHTGVALPEQLGVANLDSNGTYAFSSHADGIWRCMDAQLTTQAASVINLRLGDLSGACRMLYAMVDPILRQSSQKAAMGFYGGGPTYYRKDPRFMKRAIAQAASRVSRVRGMGFMWWDVMPRSREAYRQATARYFPEVCESLAWWNHFGELQADLLEDAVTPQPEVCVYFPRSSAWFARICPPEVTWRRWIHDRRTWLHSEVFLDFDRSQVPVDCLLPDAIERGDLSRYRVAYVLYGPRNSKPCLSALADFHRAGGYVFGSHDALTWDMTKESSATFEEIFQALPRRKIDGVPGWAKEEEKQTLRGAYEIVADHPALPPKGTVLPTFNGMLTVTPKGARVYATYRGEPCVVGTERSLFVGTDLVSDLAMLRRKEKVASVKGVARDTSRDEANVLQVLLGFVKYAGVRPPLRVTSEGQLPPRGVSAGLLVAEKRRRQLVIVSNSEARPVSLSLQLELPQGAELCDLATGSATRRGDDGRLAVTVPAREVMVLLAADADTVRAAVGRQRLVEKRSRVFDWYGSRYFFTRKEESGRGEAWYPHTNFAETYYRVPDFPHATIVLADRAPPQDRAAAERLQAMVRDYPFHQIGHWPRDRDQGLKPRTLLGVELPVRELSDATPELAKQANLIALCSERDRVAFARTLGLSAPETKGPEIAMQHCRSWRHGGNTLWLVAPPQERSMQMERVREWLWTWFDGLGGPVPRELLRRELKRRLAPREQSNGVWLAETPHGRVYYRLRTTEGTALPNKWIREVTIGRESPDPKRFSDAPIVVFSDDFTRDSPQDLGPPDWRRYLPGNFERPVLVGFTLGTEDQNGVLLTVPRKGRCSAAAHLGPACPVEVAVQLKAPAATAGLLIGDLALLTDSRARLRLTRIQKGWRMERLAEATLAPGSERSWLRVRLRCQGGTVVGTVTSPENGNVLARVQAPAQPNGPASALMPYGVVARDGGASFDDFVVRTNVKWLLGRTDGRWGEQKRAPNQLR